MPTNHMITVLVTSHIALDREFMYFVMDSPLILKTKREKTSRMAVSKRG
jgi:hypothetical protein